MPKSKIVAYYSEACFYVCSNCGLSKQFNNNAKREYEYFSKIHKKVCKENSICKTSKIESILSQEIKLAILKEAAYLKENELVIDENYRYPKFGGKEKRE